jgi:hypothetical protein
MTRIKAYDGRQGKGHTYKSLGTNDILTGRKPSIFPIAH